MEAASVLRIVKTVVGSLGILGNGLVCVVIAKVSAMRTLTNAFIFNQAVIDLLASMFLILDGNCSLAMPRNAVLAALYCYVWHTAYYLWALFVASSLNLMVLTFERYIAIVHPFKYVKFFRPKEAGFMIAAVWIISLVYKSYLFATREIVNNVCRHRNVTAVGVLGVATICVEYLIPLIFMIVCYIRIIRCLKRGAVRVAQQSSSARQGGESLRGSLVRAKRNTVKTLIIVFVTYAVCWSTNQIIFLMYNFGWPLDFQGSLYVFSVSLAAFNSCANPFIYSIKYKQFKRSAKLMLRPCVPVRVRNNRIMVASTSQDIATRGQTD